MKKFELSLNTRIVIEESVIDAILDDGDVYVKVMSGIPQGTIAEETDDEVADDTKEEKKPVKKTAQKKETPVKKQVAKKKTTKKKDDEVVLIEDWTELEKDEVVKIKLGDDLLEEDDDPEKLYNCKILSEPIEEDDIVTIEIQYLDDDVVEQFESEEEAVMDISSDIEGTEVYRIPIE